MKTIYIAVAENLPFTGRIAKEFADKDQATAWLETKVAPVGIKEYQVPANYEVNKLAFAD